MQKMLFCRGALLSLSLVGALCGCQENSTDPTAPSWAIEGTMEIVGNGLLSNVLVQVYAAPEDDQLLQIQTSHPALGFSPIAPALFDPLSQQPLASASPDSDGHFALAGLSAGDYIVNAELPDFACPEPEYLTLAENADIGTLRLVQPQPLTDIQQDTIWTTGSVFLLQNEIIVHPQAVLTIQSGVLILAQADAALIVAGGIQVLGDPENPVRFRLAEEAHAVGSVWNGILLEQPASACELSGVSFQGASTALRVLNGPAQISQCLFWACSSFAAYFSANAEGSVAHSVVLEGDQGLVADNCSPDFEYNLVLRTAGAGISVKSYSTSPVHDNVILDCQTGIWSDWETAPQIHDNLISGGLRGLDAQSGFTALVRYNEFQNQLQECIYLHVKNCYPQIEWNNFVNAPAVILHVNGNAGLQADTVFAPHNYWDGEDAATIPDRIIDGHDIGSPDNPIGPVDFNPPSTNPVPEAGP